MYTTQKDIFILAIESSCDDTSAAVLHDRKVLSNEVASQAIHNQFGGVVPELASRDHQKNIVAVVDAALKKAGTSLTQINAIAFTRGPGLMGSLLVGASFAKSLALARDLPLIEVNHMQAHILAHFIDNGQKIPGFPFLCLTVSGGHTQLVKVKDHLSMEVIGETQDDAVGEAFDKGAKILGLPYPGGPLIDKYAQNGDPHKYKFTISNMPEFNYSFSGIKTALLYYLRDLNRAGSPRVLADIAAGYQEAIVEVLVEKAFAAVSRYRVAALAVVGGVSANSRLRSLLSERAAAAGIALAIPRTALCTDNAAMIAAAARGSYLAGRWASWDLEADPEMTLPSSDTISPPMGICATRKKRSTDSVTFRRQ